MSTTAAHRFRFPSKGFIYLSLLVLSSSIVGWSSHLNHLQLCLRKKAGTNSVHPVHILSSSSLCRSRTSWPIALSRGRLSRGATCSATRRRGMLRGASAFPPAPGTLPDGAGGARAAALSSGGQGGIQPHTAPHEDALLSRGWCGKRWLRVTSDVLPWDPRPVAANRRRPALRRCVGGSRAPEASPEQFMHPCNCLPDAEQKASLPNFLMSELHW